MPALDHKVMAVTLTLWLVYSFEKAASSCCPTCIGVANGKSETRRNAETGILKSKPETKKCSNL